MSYIDEIIEAYYKKYNEVFNPVWVTGFKTKELPIECLILCG